MIAWTISTQSFPAGDSQHETACDEDERDSVARGPLPMQRDLALVSKSEKGSARDNAASTIARIVNERGIPVPLLVILNVRAVARERAQP